MLTGDRALIHWLLQAADEHPDIARGLAPAGLLCAAEQQRLDALQVLKRRRDWLLGRLTAKQLLQSVLSDEAEQAVGLHEILIDNDADGAPFAALDKGRTSASTGAGQRLAGSLSISHSRGVAFSAFYAFDPKEEQSAIGADIEFIEPRAESFIRDFFTDAEMAMVQQAGPATTAVLVTACWSAKEAVLKALRTGLRLDTRQVQCLIRPPLPVGEEWQSFEIQILDPAYAAGAWSGWWRRLPQYPDFVLTMALRTDAP